jgi:hypothetical protein
MGANQAAFLAAVIRHLDDPDWKVRAIADCYLRGEGMLPDAYRPSMLDRLRRRYLTWLVYSAQ